MKVWLTEDPSVVTDRPELIYRGSDERTARRAAARALGVATLRGLVQAATNGGTRYYAIGADDSCGASVEIEY